MFRPNNHMVSTAARFAEIAALWPSRAGRATSPAMRSYETDAAFVSLPTGAIIGAAAFFLPRVLETYAAPGTDMFTASLIATPVYLLAGIAAAYAATGLVGRSLQYAARSTRRASKQLGLIALLLVFALAAISNGAPAVVFAVGVITLGAAWALHKIAGEPQPTPEPIRSH